MKKILTICGIVMIWLFLGNTRDLIVHAGSTINVTTLNEDTTRIKNKYGITGTVLEVKQYAKSTLILTVDYLYYIVDGKSTKYDIGKMSNKASFFRKGQNVIVAPIEEKDSSGKINYLQVKVNLDSGVKQTLINYTKLQENNNLRWGREVIDFVDGVDNKWFTTQDPSLSNYYLYRIDSQGALNRFSYADTNEIVSAFTDLSLDSNDNLYYTITITNNDSWFRSVLHRIDKDLKVKEFIVYDDIIIDYKIGLMGDVWILTKNNALIHMDKNGKTLMKLTVKNAKAISITPSDKVFVLHDDQITQVVGNKLVKKVTLTKGYRYNSFQMFSDDKYSTNNENTIELINYSSRELIVSDSYVKFMPNLVKDNQGNITIISKNSIDQKDPNTKLYRISNTGIVFKDISFNLGDYWRAAGYNNEIYIPYYKGKYRTIIYRVKSNFEVEEYANYPTYGETIYDMEFDSKGNLYIFTYRGIRIITADKQYIGNSLPEFNNLYFVLPDSFIKDKYNNIYLKYVGSYHGKSKECLFNLKDIHNITQVKVTPESKYAEQIFLTENNEIAMVKTDESKTKHLYLLDSHGKSIEDHSYDLKSYLPTDWLWGLERVLYASDGTIFFDCGASLIKKAEKDEYVQAISQVIRDDYGTIYYADNSNLFIYDKVNPEVAAETPIAGEKNVTLTGKITLSINEPVLKNSDFYDISLTANGAKISIKCTISKNKIIITPSTNLKAKTKYTVTIPRKAIRDLAKNSLAENFTYSFTTR